MRTSRTALIHFIVLLVCLSPCACKEGNPITGDIVPATASFTPGNTDPNVTNRYVSLTRNRVDGGRIYFDLVVTDVDEPVSGIALKLTYPDTFSKFVACDDGDLFADGDCYFAEPSPGSGEVFIGRSLISPTQPTPVSGNVVIVRLEFLVFGQGDGWIGIEGQNLGGGDASALLDEHGDPIFVTWYSGTLHGE